MTVDIDTSMDSIYSVYMLLTETGVVFYVGFTKNFKIRMYEHRLLQGKNKAKDRIIKRMGYLNIKAQHNLSLEVAKNLEIRLIAKYKGQLTNKHAGGNYVPHQPEERAPRKRTKRRSKCPICKQRFLQLSRHRCKGVK
jgi:predicted GIY-YIG superfamily endonuclease